MPPAAPATSIATDASYSMLFSPDAASSLASPSVELEVNWDPLIIRSQLRMAVAVLSHRGLKLAAKWASEQLMGLVNTINDGCIVSGKDSPSWAHGTSSGIGDMNSNSKWIHELGNLQDRDLYAKSLLELGEYLHAAAILSETNDDVTKMSPPLPDLSNFGIYLRAYSLYMAGEKRREQDYIELKRCESFLRVCLLWRKSC